MKKQFPAAAQALQNWIFAKNFPPGKRLPSTEEMAQQFGFTPATMLRASQALVSGGLLYRQGYKLTIAHSSEKPTLPGTIIIVSCPTNDGFAHAAGSILTEKGINYRVVEIQSTKVMSLPSVLARVAAENPSGIIFRMGGVNDKVSDWIKKTSIPMVVYASNLPEVTASSVQMDAYRANEKAIAHLYQLGHRHIARFTTEHPNRTDWSDYYKAACFKRNLKESANRIWRSPNYRPDVARDILLTARKQHPEVTAIVAPDNFAVLITRLFSVPKEISVVGIGEVSRAVDSRPALTMAALPDPDVMASWACLDLIAQIQAIKSGKRPLPASEVLFVPELILGKSTRAIAPQNVIAETAKTLSLSLEHPSQTWQNIYPFLKKTGSDNFRTLDLSKLANHSMTRHHGWLGAEPLEHFPPGLRLIHGVPFKVLDEKRNGDRAVVTFRSPHSHSTGGKRLPARVRIPVNTKVRALYFLHGCGFAKPAPFAEYTMHFMSGRSIAVPLISIGASRWIAKERLKNLQPNIQDWWSGYEQQDFPHAHHATVFDASDPITYERTIYSLEWINPHPQDEVCLIEARVDPKSGPILALISVTALLDQK